LKAPVLRASRLHEPARVARVRAAGGVDEQSEQALRLRPALDGVLLVDLARALGQAPDPRVRLIAAPDALLGERREQHLRRLAALVAGPAADLVDREVERLGILERGDLLERADPQLRVLVALDRGQQEAALELAAAVEMQHRAGAAPAARLHARTGERGP